MLNIIVSSSISIIYFNYTKSGTNCPSYNFLNTANNVGDEMSGDELSGDELSASL